ncbi:hypothetical protein [Delftia tsuruhatensis]|uniref:hypothetical protein n=1 Tax=Delftia tsuruhatensis TaxID=180282 RepID=UPI002443C868|nr:hypothetical protein [Delftia tsuruhatensis]MDH1461830.1 hypothetical protein [Delftia tsuruhatensis]WGG09991.1 hypothetical protein N5O86_25605 [Delftia tsuruhatensis]
MQRVTPSEPFNPDPDARYLRVCSRPGPVHETEADGVPGGWLLAVLVVLVALAAVGCSQAGAQEPQPTAQEQSLARAAARACEGLTPVFDNGSWVCLKER